MLWKLSFITILVSNSITEFEWKIENKNDLRKQKHSTIKNDTFP
jgi:predicted secreted protein